MQTIGKPSHTEEDMLHPFEQDWEHEGQSRTPFPETSGMPTGTTPTRQHRPAGRHDAYDHTPSRDRGRRPPPSIFHGLRQFFARGNDIESSKVNHQFTREGATAPRTACRSTPHLRA